MKCILLPSGFSAAGVVAGIKGNNKKDMAMIVSDTDAVCAGVFTTNQIKAAPVLWDMDVIKEINARAIVMNSGNANACNGERGKADTKTMAEIAADKLNTDPASVFVCSTGTIGKTLPIDKISEGIETLFKNLSNENGLDAAEAMMTTDLVPKYVVKEIEVGGKKARITALAKGSGMIEPNMATMLCFVMTDAKIEKNALQTALHQATKTSFNRISVDGDQSTNDSVLALANGMADNEAISLDSDDWKTFREALKEILLKLAIMIVKDGEGATRMVTIHVSGASTDEEADLAARSVANSMLNKTSWAGLRPNWGRVMDALGYSKAQIQEDKIDISYDDVALVKDGVQNLNIDENEAYNVVKNDSFTIHIVLNIGDGEQTIYTCNCTEDYVKINVE